jgi:hypothetical protein
LPCDDALHLRVLGLELLEASQIARAHAGVFRTPESDRVGVNAMTASELAGRRAGIELAEDRNDLRLREAALAHGWISFVAPMGGNPQISLAPDFGPNAKSHLDPLMSTALTINYPGSGAFTVQSKHRQ